MRSEATINQNLDLSPLLRAFGRFFQVRDDYQNLQDMEVSRCSYPLRWVLGWSLTGYIWQYINQKGFAEDLNEGKISLPLIYALNNGDKSSSRLASILQQRKAERGLTLELRKLAADEIRSSGALDKVEKVIQGLQQVVDKTLTLYEDRLGAKNWILRLLQKRLEL